MTIDYNCEKIIEKRRKTKKIWKNNKNKTMQKNNPLQALKET